MAARRGGGRRKTVLRGKHERRKFETVLGEAERGTLRTSAGTRPVSRAQELAIAFSEVRRARKRRRT